MQFKGSFYSYHYSNVGGKVKENSVKKTFTDPKKMAAFIVQHEKAVALGSSKNTKKALPTKKKAAAKKTSSSKKKTPAKKTATKKVTKKVAPKKAVKKTTAKKVVAKKTTTKKPATKKIVFNKKK